MIGPGAPVTVWTVTGDELDERLDADVRSRLGEGEWGRRCAVCSGVDHGRRVFVPKSGAAVSVSVSHGDGVHVAATGWGRIAVGTR